MTAVAVLPNRAAGAAMEIIRRIDTNDPADSALVVILWKTMPSSSALRDADTVADLISAGGARCDFTNYADKVLEDSDISSPTVDDTDDKQRWKLPNQEPLIEAAGGDTNNAIKGITLAYDDDTESGNDSNLICLHHTLDDAGADLQETNGSDLDLSSPPDTIASAQGS